jgi:hypothetical protein
MIEDRLRRTMRRSGDRSYCLWSADVWLDEEWERVLRATGATDRDIYQAFAEFQWRLIEEMRRTPPGSVDVPHRQSTDLALEQNRQITEMWLAVRRVAALVYGEKPG